MQELPRDTVHHHQSAQCPLSPIPQSPPRHASLLGPVPRAVTIRRCRHPNIRQSHAHRRIRVLQRPHHPHLRHNHQQLSRPHHRYQPPPLPLVAVVNAPTATACTSYCCRRHVCRLSPPRAQVILWIHILGHASHKSILSDSIVSQGLRWRRTHKHAVCTAELSGGASMSQPLHFNVFHIGCCI
jgi:hypothetical protein